MTTQPEYILEENLVDQLEALGYAKVSIKDEVELIANLKGQLEKHNKTVFSEADFTQILNQLSKGNIYEKAKTLRDRITYTKDNGETGYVELINQVHWCKNQYQVTHQVTMEGSYKNRYDVTILINGLPLVQIELKKRGLEMKEAFNQINRYERHSFSSGSGLFQYVQLFVISNGVNTKYFANNPVKARSFKQTFFWADRENNIITQLSDFATAFLEPCHLSKMITKYIVLNTSNILMVLRPYQYYATEAIVERVKNSNKFGYVWHTTGSGKTLTSFKAAQILTNLGDVLKVVFVVDRKDLDYQTIKEFNSFSEGSIDATDNTSKLVRQLADETKLIVTTIQKLNTAISKPKHMAKVDKLKNERIVFIFDECHRSQFGDTHNAIKGYFENAQMFGFTGTPIFADNSVKNKLGRRTTKDLFEECLHKYVITDAIRDRNVLKFSIEYMNTVKVKEGIVDIKVEDINTAEVLEAPERLENNVDFIINNHNRKTHNRRFTAILCVQNVKTLIKYYELFQTKKEAGEHDLKVATIYSYQANQLDEDAQGFIPDEDYEDFAAEPSSKYDSKHTRDKLEEFIGDYNRMFKTNYSTNEFYSYYKDIGKRVKNKQVDILLVVNMFLTGFDSKLLNTIYVDKNLKHHGLIQAYSRTNRILDEVKSQGNVVAFRNLKEATDEAITLFSNKEAIEEIIVQPYEDYIEKFDEAVERVKAIAPTFDSVNDLVSEAEELEFVKAFRELMRVKNVLGTFTEFSFEDLGMDEQTFENYKSKYLDLYDTIRSETQKEKVSILNDIDFELELIRRDEINVTYILTLLAKLHDSEPKEQEGQRKAISDILASETQLRSKKELIEKFIEENLPLITDSELVANEFESFWTVEKKKAILGLAKEEGLEYNKLVDLVSNFLFTEKEPLRDEIIAVMHERPSLKDRATSSGRILNKIKDFIETFIDGMG
ncbi:type I restriction endonuclease subunit R [Flagellimonas amoyensis]|uniref:type I restriction endonuclease subunit R n=1 Tax=Flagellimonas amoyensis TaxID=2169401 RepID=UPI000D3C3A4C|nr:type I restriction endonuclease subunit R [Allomuricauda amoyensis]